MHHASLLFRSSILFIIKHRSITFVQLVNYTVRDYPELDPKIIRRIVIMRIKGYSQLIDIVNFCGKQHNISSSKKHMALIYCQWSNDLVFITRSRISVPLPPNRSLASSERSSLKHHTSEHKWNTNEHKWNTNEHK